MMHLVVMFGLISGLKLQEKIEKEIPSEETDYELCSRTRQRENKTGWRVRAICNEDNSDRLEDYLEASRKHTESLALETVDTEGGRRRRKNGGRRRRSASKIITNMYEGKFCEQGDQSGLGPVASFTYGATVGDKTETKFKIAVGDAAPYCYKLECNGRCDPIDPSVKFECVAQEDADGKLVTDKAKFNKLKATWFKKNSCVASFKPDDDDTKPDIPTDGFYYYSPDEVKTLNEGFQGKFCWDTGIAEAADSNNDKWNDIQGTDNYYSFSTNQQMPTCPPPGVPADVGY